ncbi:rod shape-determining protein RodA [Thiospirochaeta perfilievii]|uniref:Cell wall polymerase n=1 Tax=Thiospirochaeta perfilievii TaxID=252967 RepID=A0A5C1QIN3_9SPIO|nr:rod shape-determining protein RodA [Thiospirochaeta perfilievii]
MDVGKSLSRIDFFMLAAVFVLMFLGVMFIYSSGISSIGVNTSNEYVKQVVRIISGLFVLVFFSLYDIEKIKSISLITYLFLIFVLIYTRLFGTLVNGARSWIYVGGFVFQPSEFTKLTTILFLGKYLDDNQKDIRSLKVFITSFIIISIPFGLILLQPDMGTASVYIPIFLAMLFISGCNIKYLTYLILLGALTLVLTMLPGWETYILQSNNTFVSVLTEPRLILYLIGSITFSILLSLIGLLYFKKEYFNWLIYFFSIIVFSLILSFVAREYVLKDYQIMRLIVFMNPQVDPLNFGWNIIQATTAVGSGGFSGKGFLQGTQSHYQFLPEQSTDFIFSILSEELGFLGALLVFGLFLIILIRGLLILTYAKNNFSILVGSGIIGMIFFHVILNVGMNIGLMPITGIPLFFLSYGGSSLWTALAGIGILQGIYQRRYRN